MPVVEKNAMSVENPKPPERTPELLALLEVHLEVPAERLALGDFWDCPESPTGYCVYDFPNDRAHDHCLVCGQPEERK